MDDDEGLDTWPVAELVREVLGSFSRPYPKDIVDQVCLTIERNPAWLSRYHALIEHFSSRGKNGRLTVNSSIGWFTKDLTGMVNTGKMGTAKSRLLQSYSILRHHNVEKTR